MHLPTKFHHPALNRSEVMLTNKPTNKQARCSSWHQTNSAKALTKLLLLPIYGPLSGTTRVSRYQKKHSPTHTYPDHQSSSVCFLPLIKIHGNPCSIYMPDSPSLLWSTSWSGTLHFIVHTSPNHCVLFATHAHTNAICFAVVPRMSPNPSLSLNSLLGTNATHPSDILISHW